MKCVLFMLFVILNFFTDNTVINHDHLIKNDYESENFETSQEMEIYKNSSFADLYIRYAYELRDSFEIEKITSDKSGLWKSFKQHIENDYSVIKDKLHILDLFNKCQYMNDKEDENIKDFFMNNINNLFYGYYISEVLSSFAHVYVQNFPDAKIKCINEDMEAPIKSDELNIKNWLNILDFTFTSSLDAENLYRIIDNMWQNMAYNFMLKLLESYQERNIYKRKCCDECLSNCKRIKNIYSYYCGIIFSSIDANHTACLDIRKVKRFLHKIQVVCVKSSAVFDSRKRYYKYNFSDDCIEENSVRCLRDFMRCILFYAQESGLVIDVNFHDKEIMITQYDSFMKNLYYFYAYIATINNGEYEIGDYYLINCIRSISLMEYAYQMFDLDL